MKVLISRSVDARLSWLTGLIRQQIDMDVVSKDIDDPIELLLTIRETAADVVIIRLNDADEDPGICSNLLAEYPRLLILALPLEGGRGFLYQQSVSKQALPEVSETYVLSAMRTGEISLSGA